MMRRLIEFIDSLISHRVDAEDFFTLSSARKFVMLSAIATGIYSLFGVVCYFEKLWLLLEIDLLIIGGIIINFAFFWVYFKPTLSSKFMVATLVVGVMATSLKSGGIEAPELIWFAVFPIFVLVLADFKSALISGIILMGWFSVLRYGVGTIVPAISEIGPEKLGEFRVYHSVACIYILLFTMFFRRTEYATLFDSLKSQRDEMLAIMIELGHIESTLEKQVSDNENLVRTICDEISFTLEPVSDLLQNPFEVTEKESKMLKSAQNAGQVILDIVNQVRNFQAIASGNAELKLQNVDVKTVFEKAELIFKSAIEKKALKFIWDEGNGSPWVKTDLSAFSNGVFNNIISNSIKFSNLGERIRVKSIEEENHIHIVIQDEGIGMPESILKNLFEPNKKTSRKGTGGEKGTGFGMPIAKTYLDRLGGRIEVTSVCRDHDSKNHGSTFNIWLPKGVPQVQTQVVKDQTAFNSAA